MIVRKSSGYTLYTRDGKRVLGHHASREEAEAQERAIGHAVLARESRVLHPAPRKPRGRSRVSFGRKPARLGG